VVETMTPVFMAVHRGGSSEDGMLDMVVLPTAQ